MSDDDELAVTDDDVAGLPTSTSLRLLKLDGRLLMSDAQLLTLLSACPLLERLSLESMSHLTLSVLPTIGRASRHLQTLRLGDASPSLFTSSPAVLDALNSCISSTRGPVFAHLHSLSLNAMMKESNCHGEGKPPPYSGSTLSSLVLLLLSSTLRSLDLNLDFSSPEHLLLFAPLTRLEELSYDSDWQMSPTCMRRASTSKADIERDLTPFNRSTIGLGTGLSNVHRLVFVEERSLHDGQVKNGRELFIDSMCEP